MLFATHLSLRFHCFRSSALSSKICDYETLSNSSCLACRSTKFQQIFIEDLMVRLRYSKVSVNNFRNRLPFFSLPTNNMVAWNTEYCSSSIWSFYRYQCYYSSLYYSIYITIRFIYEDIIYRQLTKKSLKKQKHMFD